MNPVLKICVLGLLLLWPLTENVDAGDVRWALRAGLKDLDAEKGHPSLCVLTDATYVRLHGKTSDSALDHLHLSAGLSSKRLPLAR